MSNSLSLFQALQQLTQRVAEFAAPIPDQSDSAENWQAIVFELMGNNFFLPMKHVKEVFPTPGVTRIPGVQKWVKGIANVRGEILALIDLNDFFATGRASNPVLSRVVAVEIGEMRFGMVVDRVVGMRQVNQSAVQSGAAVSCPSEIMNYVSGAVQLDDKEANLFEPLKIIKSDTFDNVSTL